MPRQGEFIHSPIAAKCSSQPLPTRKPVQKIWEMPEMDPPAPPRHGSGS